MDAYLLFHNRLFVGQSNMAPNDFYFFAWEPSRFSLLQAACEMLSDFHGDTTQQQYRPLFLESRQSTRRCPRVPSLKRMTGTAGDRWTAVHYVCEILMMGFT